jgi:hypothetical protein
MPKIKCDAVDCLYNRESWCTVNGQVDMVKRLGDLGDYVECLDYTPLTPDEFLQIFGKKS